MQTTYEEQQMQKVWVTYEIQKLFGKFAFMLAEGRYREAVETLWAQRIDASLGSNDGFYLGYQSILEKFVGVYERGLQAELDVLSTLDCRVTNCTNALGTGILAMHCLTTPLIEISNDLETAKGMWYSPGYENRLDEVGSPVALWSYSRYAVDFIRESGQWKLWHVFIGHDFTFPAGTHLNRRSISVPSPAVSKQIPEDIQYKPRAEDYVQPYDVLVPGLYSIDYGWSGYPPVPEAYDTFANTFSYGAEPFLD